jgi:hypothetical protein
MKSLIGFLFFLLIITGCLAPASVSRGSFWIRCDTLYFSGEDEDTGELFLIEEIRCDTVYFDSIPPYPWVRDGMG